MGNHKKQTNEVGGPFVACAILCQSITEDSNGVVSALRIVDEIRVVIPAKTQAEYPSKTNPVDLSLFALIMIRRGDARVGKRRLKLVIEEPSGETKEAFNGEIEMPKYPNGTSTVKAKMSMKLHSQGVYWIDVILGSQRLTRMALNLLLQRIETPTA